jgi:hypothetical protein
MPKYTFAATGTSAEFNAINGVVAFADFTSGSGSGSATLQVKLGGEWVTALEALTGTSTAAAVIHPQGKSLCYRWSVTRSGGTIYTYLE